MSSILHAPHFSTLYPQLAQSSFVAYEKISKTAEYGGQGRPHKSQAAQYESEGAEYGSQGRPHKSQAAQYESAGAEYGSQGRPHKSQATQYESEGAEYGSQGRPHKSQYQSSGSLTFYFIYFVDLLLATSCQMKNHLHHATQ